MNAKKSCVWCAVQLGADLPVEALIAHAVPADVSALAARREDKKQTALAARGLLRCVVSQMTGCSDWRICPDARGKPFLYSDDNHAGPQMSVSHSGAWVAVAVSPEQMLGIDVEVHRTRDFPKLAAYAFGPQEACVAQKSLSDFYRLWTLREAMGKWDGQGLRLAANGRDEICCPENTGAWQDGAWNLFSCALGHASLADASLAIAMQGAEEWRGETIMRLTPADLVL